MAATLAALRPIWTNLDRRLHIKSPIPPTYVPLDPGATVEKAWAAAIRGLPSC